MNAITRVPLLDETVSSIKEYIQSGSVKAGDKMLTEAKICEMLGVGRSTVREALRMLQAMGYLEMKPGKGSYILRTEEPGITDQYKKAVQWFIENECQITELLEFRRFLEPFVTRLSVERITDKEIESLVAIMDNFEKAYYDNDYIKLNLYEKSFHTAIIRACHNKMFISIYDYIMIFLSDYFKMTFSISQVGHQSLEPHKRILNAICQRNVELAASEMRAHINLTISNMMDVVSNSKSNNDQGVNAI